MEWGLGIGDWGLGIGDRGLGIGDWAQSPIPNTQSPIPNPQSPTTTKLTLNYNYFSSIISMVNNKVIKINKKRLFYVYINLISFFFLLRNNLLSFLLLFDC